jgi:preprotein translocase subunit SecG
VGFLTVICVIIFVLVCLFLIMVVLLQQGKGADLAGAFGGGGSQTSFGPRSRTSWLHIATTCSFVLFIVLSMTLAILSGKRGVSRMEGVAPGEGAPAAVEESVPADPGMGAAEESDAAELAGATTDEPAPAEATTPENESGEVPGPVTEEENPEPSS